MCSCGATAPAQQDCCEPGLVCSSDGPYESYTCKLAIGEPCSRDAECGSAVYDRTVACKRPPQGAKARCCVPGLGFVQSFSYEQQRLHQPVGDTAEYCCFPELTDSAAPDENKEDYVVCL